MAAKFCSRCTIPILVCVQKKLKIVVFMLLPCKSSFLSFVYVCYVSMPRHLRVHLSVTAWLNWLKWKELDIVPEPSWICHLILSCTMSRALGKNGRDKNNLGTCRTKLETRASFSCKRLILALSRKKSGWMNWGKKIKSSLATANPTRGELRLVSAETSIMT